MTLVQNKIEYYYDPTYDTLNIYLGKSYRFNSIENYPGIFFIYDEDTNNLIGLEILDFSHKSKIWLNNNIRIGFDFSSIK